MAVLLAAAVAGQAKPHKHSIQLYTRNSSTPRSRWPSGPQGLAVVTIAMGGYQATELSFSLRGAGEFTGPFYVLSDSCGPGRLAPETRVVRVSSAGLPQSDPTSQATKSCTHAKIWKTRVFEVVNEGRVLFLDSDIRVRRPLPRFLLEDDWGSGCDASFTHNRASSSRHTYWNTGVALFEQHRCALQTVYLTSHARLPMPSRLSPLPPTPASPPFFCAPITARG